MKRILPAQNRIEFESLPIANRGIPGMGHLVSELVTKLASDLRAGKNVAIHSRQGIGRGASLRCPCSSDLASKSKPPSGLLKLHAGFPSRRLLSSDNGSWITRDNRRSQFPLEPMALEPSHMLPLSRREMLARCGTGIGTIALAGVMADDAGAPPVAHAPGTAIDPLAPKPPHFPAKAKHVIHLFMNGGPSQVDTFDPKPALDEVPRQAAPDRQPPHRAQDRRGDAVAVQVQEVRPERHRGQRDLRQDRRRTSTTCASSARCTPTSRTTSRRCC